MKIITPHRKFNGEHSHLPNIKTDLKAYKKYGSN